ncbi:MAG: VOC family protein [Parvularculaceae bacterium]
MKIHEPQGEDALTLVLDVTIEAPRASVWRCWTEAPLLKEWHCPKPWRVESADLEARPGGRFNTVFAGPAGERHENTGMFLAVEPMARLVFTDGYREGFIPAPQRFMTGFVEFSDDGEERTRMVWGARHATEADAKTHLEMGFRDGWKAAAQQLEDLARTLPQPEPAGLRKKARACLWFEKSGLEAAQFYVSLLPGSFIEATFQNGAPHEPMVVEFTLAGAPLMILNGGPHYNLTPAASISVLTKTQEETDRLWSALLSGGGRESRCGWLEDRFGVSWQIVPEALPRLMNSGDPAAGAGGAPQ